MACNCTKGEKSPAKQYVVKKPNNTTYKTYGTRIEAEAAAKRVGGTVVVK